MANKRPGFTLIELLVVIAIIGILAALFIPQVMNAIQKSKQKAALKDINSIATAIMDFVTDKGTAPAGVSDQLSSSSPLYSAINGFYLKVLPMNDQWGTPFYVWCGTLAESAYTGVTNCGYDDFVVASAGRDKTPTAISFDPLQPTSAFFDIVNMQSFNQDLVNWNGSWIHAPKSAQPDSLT